MACRGARVQAEGKKQGKQSMRMSKRFLWTRRADALINCGTLYYEDGNLEKASEYFRQV